MSLSVVGYTSSASALVLMLMLMLVTMSSCYDDGPYRDLLAYQEGLTSSTGETTDVDPAPNGSSVSTSLTGTASGDSSGDSSSSGGGGLDLGDDLEPSAPPEIFEFTATPGKVNAAGPLLFDLKVSDDVQEIELIRADNGGDTLAKLPPEDLPFHHAIVSAADNGSHRYRAIARNDRGEEARAELEVTVALPATGQEIWSWESDHPGSEAFAIQPLDGGAVVAGHTTKDDLPVPVVSRISNTGKLLWEVFPTDERGYACALTLRPQGDLIVIGNRYEDIHFNQTMWMRQLSLDGEVSPIWGDDGVTGERAWAVTTDEFGQIIIAGDYFDTSAVKPHYDLRVWLYDSSGASRWTSTWDAQSPELTSANEQGHAALILPSGDILVAGHTSRDLAMPAREQALILKLDQGGNFDDAPWIDDNPEYSSTKVRSLARSDKGDLFVSGRAIDAATKTTRAMVWRVDEDLKIQLWNRAVGQGDEVFAKSVRLTANNNIVVGSTKDARFQVTIAKPAGNAPFIWQEELEFSAGPDLLHDLTLDPYDYIYVTGQAMIGVNHRAYARRLAP